jgi:hypothetical protein
MTESEYASARAAVLAGKDPSAALLDDCRRSVALLVRNGGLPAHYSPYGVWTEEAINEVYADWVAERLVRRGQLRAMLQRAPLLAVFRRMAETSARQHLIDSRVRSQASNLYARVVALLDGERFASTGSGTGELWRLAVGPEAPFEGDDRRLLGLAWSLGEFVAVRYDAQARKLSPLLASEDLERFVVGMLEGGAMTAATIVRALRLRFGLEDDERPGELDDALRGPANEPLNELIVDELATATLAELSGRQAKVLAAWDTPVRDLALQLGCSTGTISHERARIADILARLGGDAAAVLNKISEALFKEDE